MPESGVDDTLDKLVVRLMKSALELYKDRTDNLSEREILVMTTVATAGATLSIATSLRSISESIRQLVPTPEKRSSNQSLCEHIIMKSAANTCCFRCGLSEHKIKERGQFYSIV